MQQAVDLAKDFKSPGADLEGIYTFRDVVDADTILAAIPDVKKRGGKVHILALPFQLEINTSGPPRPAVLAQQNFATSGALQSAEIWSAGSCTRAATYSAWSAWLLQAAGRGRVTCCTAI